VGTITLTLIHNGVETRLSGVPCTPLLTFLQNAETDISLHSPCGGKKSCGKCKIRILSGECDAPTERELSFLTDDERARGMRLACFAQALSDVTAEIPSEQAHILTELDGGNTLAPTASKHFVQLAPPSLDDQRDDWQRLKDGLGLPQLTCRTALLQSLSGALQTGGYAATVTIIGGFLTDVQPGEQPLDVFGLAADIGTTTVVMALVNLRTGAVVATESGLNRQSTFGGDVISRIQHALENESGGESLRSAIVEQLNALATALCARNNLQTTDILSVSLVGNTVMSHLLLGLPTTAIAKAPFIPVCNETVQTTTPEIGLRLHPDCTVLVAGGVSAYVGGDITAGVLASDLMQSDALSLFIDIGTNGEIALGNRGKLVSCSTAAGPAFEGGHIRCGTGGVSGAINSLHMERGNPVFTTIGDAPAIGICGSGVLDVTAALLDAGLLDETGYLETDDELDDTAIYRITNDVYFSAKDAREVQLAKAAVRAGIDTLLHAVGAAENDVQHVYLAGGFGNYMDQNSAIRIGLIPAVLRERIIPLGNAAGSGAVRLLLDANAVTALEALRGKMTYYELSANPFFQNAYVEQMMFPEE